MVLFAIVFFWTPPHFWSLALLLQRQYRAVGVPMLPVVAGEAQTRGAIVGYSLLLLGVSMLPAIWLGPAYGGGALLLGLLLLELALRGRSAGGLIWASRLFHFSLAYLALLFGLAAATATILR
jgi:protoheme IX farnesyltransferase